MSPRCTCDERAVHEVPTRASGRCPPAARPRSRRPSARRPRRTGAGRRAWSPAPGSASATRRPWPVARATASPGDHARAILEPDPCTPRRRSGMRPHSGGGRVCSSGIPSTRAAASERCSLGLRRALLRTRRRGRAPPMPPRSSARRRGVAETGERPRRPSPANRRGLAIERVQRERDHQRRGVARGGVGTLERGDEPGMRLVMGPSSCSRPAHPAVSCTRRSSASAGSSSSASSRAARASSNCPVAACAPARAVRSSARWSAAAPSPSVRSAARNQRAAVAGARCTAASPASRRTAIG